MSDRVNPVTGEVEEDGGRSDMLVPLNLAGIDEEQLAQIFPTPMQAHAALHMARTRLGHAPAVLDRARRALKEAQRALTVAYGRSYLNAEGPEHVRKQLASTAASTVEAQENVDSRWLELQYALDLKSALYQDIEILRSINSNMRADR